MGQPTGLGQPSPAPDSARTGPPADDYRVPLFSGLYPPLGFRPDGRPRQPTDGVPVPPGTDPAPPPIGPSPAPDHGSVPVPSATPGENDGGPPRPPIDTHATDGEDGRRRVGGAVTVLGILVIVLLVFLVARAALQRSDQQTSDANAPQVITNVPTEVPAIPTVPEEPTDPGQPPGPGAPTDPGAPIGPPGMPGAPPQDPGAPVGQHVVYSVTAATVATIIYVDDKGLRTAIGAQRQWTDAFTASGNPLRVLVLAGQGAASCTIQVDGRTVASDQITESSPRRTLSCRP